MMDDQSTIEKNARSNKEEFLTYKWTMIIDNARTIDTYAGSIDGYHRFVHVSYPSDNPEEITVYINKLYYFHYNDILHKGDLYDKVLQLVQTAEGKPITED